MNGDLVTFVKKYFFDPLFVVDRFSAHSIAVEIEGAFHAVLVENGRKAPILRIAVVVAEGGGFGFAVRESHKYRSHILTSLLCFYLFYHKPPKKSIKKSMLQNFVCSMLQRVAKLRFTTRKQIRALAPHAKKPAFLYFSAKATRLFNPAVLKIQVSCNRRSFLFPASIW